MRKAFALIPMAWLLACQGTSDEEMVRVKDSDRLLAKYVEVELTADLSVLAEWERRMLPPLFEAADAMNRIFWKQAYGDRQALLDSLEEPSLRRFAEINYGPWDRLEGNRPFAPGAGPKPPGANFYPPDLTREEFEAALQESPESAEEMRSLYTLIERDESGALRAIPYRQAFADDVQLAADRLRQAAEHSENEALRRYLTLRAASLLSDSYRESDLAWLDMKDNVLEVVIGPIETYEDQLFGYKAAHEAFILIKDLEWSSRLERYAALLPRLQRALPAPEKYKQEEPGSDSDLNAYDALYYAGDANAGAKTIAINLPNDEQVQLEKGTRRLQLKNSMRAKFEKILEPISNLLIADDQLRHISFDAFFQNTMFHEVAHGLGIKNVVNRDLSVREALREQASWVEEGKADVLGLFMVTWLHENGELSDGDLMDNYVTFLAGIFRSIRFGAASAHGRANLVRFNYFQEAGAFS
ncbi:MAG TPA: Zn-dependent hydrolase, partial [Acidobacteriota bacterium]|nr:Zn-dependent hydrolase [Acidobacteriota bacterium]